MVLPVPTEAENFCSYSVPVYDKSDGLIAKIPGTDQKFAFGTNSSIPLDEEHKLLEDIGTTDSNWPGDPKFVWRCHRKTRPGEGRCLFHQTPADRKVSDSLLAQLFVAAINGTLNERVPELLNEPVPHKNTSDERSILEVVPSENEIHNRDSIARRANQFIGAKFKNVDIPYTRLDAPNPYPIDLRGATIGTLNLYQSDIMHEIQGESIAADNLIFTGAKLEGDVNLMNISIANSSSFENTRFQNSITLSGSNIGGDVGFTNAEIQGSVTTVATRINGDLWFNSATVHGHVGMARAQIGGSIIFDETYFSDKILLPYSDIGGSVSLDEAIIERELSFLNANLVEGVWIGNVTIGGDFLLKYAKVGGDLGLTPDSFQQGEIMEAFRRSKITTGPFNPVIKGHLVLNHAEIGGAIRLLGSRINGDLRLQYSELGDYLCIAGVSIGGDVFIGSTDVKGAKAEETIETTIGGDVLVDNTKIAGCVSLLRVDIKGDASLRNATVKKNILIEEVITNGLVDLSGLTVCEGIQADFGFLNHPLANAVLVRQADIPSGRFYQSNDQNGGRFHRRDGVVYDLRNATIGQVTIDEFQTNDFDVKVFEYVRFLETTFTKFQYNKNRQDFHAIGWNLTGLRPEGRTDIARAASMIGMSPLGGNSQRIQDPVSVVAKEYLDDLLESGEIESFKDALVDTHDLSELREYLPGKEDRDGVPAPHQKIRVDDGSLWVDDPIARINIRHRLRRLFGFRNPKSPSGRRYYGAVSDVRGELNDRDISVLRAWTKAGKPTPSRKAIKHYERLDKALEELSEDDGITAAEQTHLKSDIIDQFLTWHNSRVWVGEEDVDILEELHETLDLTDDEESIKDALWYPTLRLWNDLEIDSDERSARARALAIVLEGVLEELPIGPDENYIHPSERKARTIFEALAIAAADARIYEEDPTPIEERKLDLDTLVATYAMAKNGAVDQGENPAASAFFQLEMKYTRLQHWQELRRAWHDLKAILFDWNTYQSHTGLDGSTGDPGGPSKPEPATVLDGGEMVLPDSNASKGDPVGQMTDEVGDDANHSSSDEGDTVDADYPKADEIERRSKQERSRLRETWLHLKRFSRYAFSWGVNVILWAVTGYGEKSSHVVATSTVVVLVWAFGFGVYDNLLTPSAPIFTVGPYGDGALGYLILSVESFLTFVLASPSGLTPGLHLMALIEGFIGVFLIAVFVVTLTRSVHR